MDIIFSKSGCKAHILCFHISDNTCLETDVLCQILTQSIKHVLWKHTWLWWNHAVKQLLFTTCCLAVRQCHLSLIVSAVELVSHYKQCTAVIFQPEWLALQSLKWHTDNYNQCFLYIEILPLNTSVDTINMTILYRVCCQVLATFTHHYMCWNTTYIIYIISILI